MMPPDSNPLIFPSIRTGIKLIGLGWRKLLFKYKHYPKCSPVRTYKSLLVGTGGANPGISLISLLLGFTICKKKKMLLVNFK